MNTCSVSGIVLLLTVIKKGCCTRNRSDGPAVTESRYVLGCNENGGHGEVVKGSC